MKRELTKIAMVLGDRTVECLCRYQTLDGFEADRWLVLPDDDLVAFAVAQGAETWDESHVAALLDERYPYTNLLTNEQVATVVLTPVVPD